MKVAIYGETDRYGTGAWCYKQALSRCGSLVLEYDVTNGLNHYFNHILWRIHRKLGGPIPSRLRQRNTAPFVDLCLKEKPDIVIILKGLYFSADDVSKLKSSGAWVVNINHDDFFSKNRNNWSSLQRNALKVYDHVFTTRSVNVGEVSSYNRKVEFFPFAYEPAIHRILSAESEGGGGLDAIFVGTHEAQRASLMETLVNTMPVNIGIYGEGWERLRADSPLKSKVNGKGLWGDDMARALGSAKIALGFLRKENRDEYTQRSFEIPACGGLFLAERTPTHTRFFVEGVEAEFFDPDIPDEMISKVKLLLSDKNRRDSLRLAGNTAVLRGKHTYDDRVSRLFELYLRRNKH